MKYLEFCYLTDPHIEVHSRYVDDYLEPIKKAFNQVIYYCKQRGIKKVVIGGDVFNTPTPKKSSQIAFLDLMVSSGLEWYIILGNHEYVFNDNNNEELEDVNAFQLIKYFEEINALPNIHIYLKPKIEKLDGVRCRFLPFPYTSYKPEKEAITFGHFSVSGYRTDSGREISDGVKYTDINDKLTILGHLHTKQMPLYPGSIIQNNFGEDTNKGFCHCIVTSKDKHLQLEQKWIPIELPFELVNIIIEKPEDFNKLKKYSDPYYRLKLIVRNDVALPSDYTVKYPNVVKTEGFKTKKEALLIQKGVMILQKADVNKLDERKLFKKFLKARGLKKPQIQRCKEIINSLYAKVGH